jgi:hypothetical protein
MPELPKNFLGAFVCSQFHSVFHQVHLKQGGFGSSIEVVFATAEVYPANGMPSQKYD